jgi:hypothetical protein
VSALHQGCDDVVFNAADGSTWTVSAFGGPDLRTMDDRGRAILRALLRLSLDRLDAAEQRLAEENR